MTGILNFIDAIPRQGSLLSIFAGLVAALGAFLEASTRELLVIWDHQGEVRWVRAPLSVDVKHDSATASFDRESSSLLVFAPVLKR